MNKDLEEIRESIDSLNQSVITLTGVANDLATGMRPALDAMAEAVSELADAIRTRSA